MRVRQDEFTNEGQFVGDSGLALTKANKQTMDPKGILNLGKVLP